MKRGAHNPKPLIILNTPIPIRIWNTPYIHGTPADLKIHCKPSGLPLVEPKDIAIATDK